MLNLVHVRTFLSVAEAGGLRAAARRLAISPATVVEHLDRLERELGAPLVARRRPSALTPEGALFAPLASALVATAERAREVVAGRSIRLAAASNIGVYLLLPLLAGWQRGGGAPVELWIGPNPEVAGRLASGAADLAAMEWWDGRPGFEARDWRREPLVAIAPPGHPWEALAEVPAEALAGETILGGEPGSGTGTALREALGDGVARLTLLGGFGSTEAVKRGVRAGLGVSLVLEGSVADERASGSLVVRPVRGGGLAKTLRLVLPAVADAAAPARRLAAHLAGEAVPTG